MKLIYVGNNEYGRYVAEDLCSEKGITFETVPFDNGQPHLLKLLEEKIIRAAGQVVMVDLSDIESSEEEVTEVIDHIRLAANCNMIIFCPGFDLNSRQIASLEAIGIIHFIFEGKRLGAIRTALQSALETPANSTSNEQIIQNREILYDQILGSRTISPGISSPLSFSNPVKKIGVVGCMSRIGTTTTALQLVKYLNLQSESSACYVQMQPGYVENIRHFYNVEDAADSVIFNNIRLYQHPATVSDILKAGYTYLVYDYSSIDQADIVSLVERDIIIAVGGTGPDELSQFPKLIELLHGNPITNYIFNFVSDADRQAVLSMMQDKADRSHFLEFTPDPFVYNIRHNDLFHAVMQTQLPVSAEQMDKNKPRKRLFRK